MKKLIVSIFLVVNSLLFIANSNAQYTNLVNFNLSNGAGPLGSLISDGTFLYGMTQGGGTYGKGSIFKMMPDGSGFLNIFDFTSTVYDTIGANPLGSLFFDGTYLYGMTQYGGINEYGTLFKILPDGSGYMDLLDFADTSNGSNPYGSVISDGVFLYGMTTYGGAYNGGTIFKIMPDGSGYDKLLDFSYSGGINPWGALIYDGTFLYGMTNMAGVNNGGAIFKIMPDGTGYTSILDFDWVNNGHAPQSSLVSDGTYLYGTTRLGGANDKGTIFKIMPDGSGCTTILNFAGVTNGANPYGSLIYDGTFLYGMTADGGVSDSGTVYKIMPDGSGYVKLLDFIGPANGSHPLGDLIINGNFLYGMTMLGGTSGYGTVFKFQYCIPPAISFVVSPNDTVLCGTNVSLSGTGASSYVWSGGIIDGIPFSVASNATYTVTGTDALGCTNTTTAGIIIQNSDIHGHVSYTGGNVTSGVAILYPVDSGFAAFDTLQIQTLDPSGNYLFTNVPQGDYLIKVFNDTIAYPAITSTYYGNEWLWDSAAVISHNCNIDDTADIVMIELNLGGGLGLFQGQIIEGYGWGRAFGDPIEGINVKLGITGNSQIVASTLTDANGNYSFNNMQLGNYTVYVDIPGLNRDSSHTFIADSSNYQFLCLDYLVDSSAIYRLPCITTLNTISIDQNNFGVYPNPIGENTIIEYYIGFDAFVKLDIYNVFGVKSQSLVNSKQEIGSYMLSFNPKNFNLKSGVYFITLSVNGKTSTKRVFVIE